MTPHPPGSRLAAVTLAALATVASSASPACQPAAGCQALASLAAIATVAPSVSPARQPPSGCQVPAACQVPSGRPAPAAAQPTAVCQPPAAWLDSQANGLFDLYAENRTRGIPNLVTLDLFLAAYSALAQTEQTRLEKDQAVPMLLSVTDALATALQRQPPKDPATTLNRRFIALLRLLQRGNEADEKDLPEAARRELQAIHAAAGITRSPLFGYPIDYSQLRPRGAYAADPVLARYFVTTRYASTVLFHLVPSRATGVTPKDTDRQFGAAEQLASLLRSDESLSKTYTALVRLSDELIGPPDDLPAEALLEAGGDGLTPTTRHRRALAWAKTNNLLPTVLGEVVDPSKLEHGMTVPLVTLGWRLLPSRRTVESAALQSLVHTGTADFRWTPAKPSDAAQPPFLARNVAGGGVYKVFPSVLELGAALDDPTSLAELSRSGNQDFPEFETALSHPYQQAAAALAEGATLPAARQVLMRFLWAASTGAPGYRPAAAFWTLERHRELLYAKQSYAATGKGFKPPPELPPARSGAGIDADPSALLALRYLVDRRARVAPAPSWTRFADLLDRLIEINDRERLAQRLRPEDEEFLEDVDRQLRELAPTGDAPMVVDIHVDPGSAAALYEATGLPEVLATCTQRGAHLRHYEFIAPLAPRMSDEDWRAVLADGDLASRRIQLAPWSGPFQPRHRPREQDHVEPLKP